MKEAFHHCENAAWKKLVTHFDSMITWLRVWMEVRVFWVEHSPALTSPRSRNLPNSLPDGVRQANAPSFGRRADRRALERNIKSTLWAENVPLCVCTCVFVQTFFPLGRLLGGNVRFSRSGKCVCVCVCALDRESCWLCAWCSLSACFCLWMCVCVTDIMFELTQTDKPNHDTQTYTHIWSECVKCVSVCVC